MLSQVHIIQYNTIQYNTVQCGAVRCSAVQCSAMRCGAVRYGTMQCNATQRNATQRNATQHNTTQYNTTKTTPDSMIKQCRAGWLAQKVLDNKVHWVNMGPTWILSAPDGPHVDPMDLAIRVLLLDATRHTDSCWEGIISPCHSWKTAGSKLNTADLYMPHDFIALVVHYTLIPEQCYEQSFDIIKLTFLVDLCTYNMGVFESF